jgi:hypothetical protein
MADLAESVGVTGWMFHINYGMQPHERVKEQMHQLHEEIVPAFNQPSQPASDGGGA